MLPFNDSTKITEKPSSCGYNMNMIVPGHQSTGGIKGPEHSLCTELDLKSMSGLNKNIRVQRAHAIFVDLLDAQQIKESCLSSVQLCDLVPSESMFLLDLTAHGYPLKDFQTLHVSFPSTLLRRPRTTFNQLVSTLHHETQSLLTEKLTKSDRIIIFDDFSSLHHCSQQTSTVIMKLLPFLSERNPSFSMSIIEGGVSSFNKQRYPQSPKEVLPSFKITPNSPKENKHPSLKLHIPKNNDSKTSPNVYSSSSANMFIQSLKKDVIHYSPNSLKKYFVFHTPAELPQHIPKWLVPYNTSSDKVLERILGDFEALESLEVRRLEKCLLASTPSSMDGSTQCSTKEHKTTNPKKDPRYYSLRQLRKAYKPNAQVCESDEDTFILKHSDISVDGKLRRDINEELNDSSKDNLIGKLNSVSPGLLPHTLTNLPNNVPESIPELLQLKEEDDEANREKLSEQDEEVAETPLSNYQMTKGIQSFAKNRYSNILPYEHSRVKLQPSPISEADPLNKNVQSTSPSKEAEINTVSSQSGIKNIKSSFDHSTEEKTVVNTDDFCYFSQEASPPRNCSYSNHEGSLDVTATQQKEPFNDYFNANYLKLPQINPDFNYIATQAPLPSTIDDFWNVVLSNNLKVIISLNSYDELNMKKWDIYWNSRSIYKHSVQVIDTYEDVFNIPGCILRVMKVSKSDVDISSPTKRSKLDGKSGNNSGTHTVYQLQYTKWLDSCGINMKDFIHVYHIKNLLLNDPSSLINALNNKTEDFLDTYKRLRLTSINLNKSGSPVLVHCSAGCGRTGVFITLDFLLGVLDPRSNQSNKIDVWNMSTDLIFIVVNELRKQRISMVQNMTQYLTCYESMLEYFYLKERI